MYFSKFSFPFPFTFKISLAILVVGATSHPTPAVIGTTNILCPNSFSVFDVPVDAKKTLESIAFKILFSCFDFYNSFSFF